MAEEAEGAKRRNRGPDERHKRMRAAFAQAFLGALAEKKVSQVEVANAIGEPAYTVSRYAKQKTTPTKQTLDKIAAPRPRDPAGGMGAGPRCLGRRCRTSAPDAVGQPGRRGDHWPRCYAAGHIRSSARALFRAFRSCSLERAAPSETSLSLQRRSTSRAAAEAG